MISPTSSRLFWQTRASRLARRINLAGWIARAAPAVFFAASGLAVVAFALRRARLPLEFFWPGALLVLAATAAGAWWRARRGFYSEADARVLLEEKLQLDTRLTAAAQGIVAWPEPAELRPILQWRLRGALTWIAAAAGLLALSVWAPLPAAGGARVTSSPPSLLRAQEMLAALKQAEVADPQALQRLEDRVAELARRPTDEQYSHSALEAADALRDQTAADAAQLAQGLDAAASALRSANSGRDLKGPAGRLGAALGGLRSGSMPANENLLSQLPGSELDLSKLSPKQREQLAQKLADAAGQCSGVGGAAGAGASVAQPDPNAKWNDGTGKGVGAGGPGGGGDTAPLMLTSNPSDAGPGTIEGLSGDALKRFSLGDKLGTTTGAHHVDTEKSAGPASAGTVAAPAAGGEAVWVNRLTPTERRALREFFK